MVLSQVAELTLLVVNSSVVFSEGAWSGHRYFERHTSCYSNSAFVRFSRRISDAGLIGTECTQS